jgi:hypothetical protein
MKTSATILEFQGGELFVPPNSRDIGHIAVYAPVWSSINKLLPYTLRIRTSSDLVCMALSSNMSFPFWYLSKLETTNVTISDAGCMIFHHGVTDYEADEVGDQSTSC